MINRTVFSTFNWNKASFRLQLSRIRQALLLLVLLPSLVGMQPTRVNAVRALAGNDTPYVADRSYFIYKCAYRWMLTGKAG